MRHFPIWITAFLFTCSTLTFAASVPPNLPIPLPQALDPTAPTDVHTWRRQASAYALIDIAGMQRPELRALKSQAGLAWWVELEDQLLILADRTVLDRLAADFTLDTLTIPVDVDRLFFLGLDHGDNPTQFDLWELGRAGRVAVVQSRQGSAKQLLTDPDGHQPTVLPFKPFTVLAPQVSETGAKREIGPDPLIQFMVNQVNGQQWLADLDFLSCFNRYTRGAEIHDARDWLVSAFQQIPGLSVRTETFMVTSTVAYNVIAVLPGTTNPDDWYIVGAHYDSTSENPSFAAPGAEDNASGSAAVLEMARIFAANPPGPTMLFICYSGEEQGLHGSRDHVSRLIDDGDSDKVQAALIMDMIGFTANETLDCLLETSQIASFMVDAFSEAASLYTDLVTPVSFNPFGSDHVPYLSNGIPALLAIENDWNRYPGYHRTSDLPSNITLAMGVGTIKMNVAAMAKLMGMGIQGQLKAYIRTWPQANQKPLTFDINGNGRIDVSELICAIGVTSP